MRAVALALVLVAASLCSGDDKSTKPITPTEAARKINETCTVEMEVKSTGISRAMIFLNSESNHRDPGNFTIVIPGKIAEGMKKEKIADPAAHFKGKTIQVTGTVTLFNEKPQIRLEDPKQIKVVDKKT